MYYLIQSKRDHDDCEVVAPEAIIARIDARSGRSIGAYIVSTAIPSTRRRYGRESAYVAAKGGEGFIVSLIRSSYPPVLEAGNNARLPAMVRQRTLTPQRPSSNVQPSSQARSYPVSHFNYNGPRMQYVYTRSGLAPALVPERPKRYALPIKWYAPKPRGFDHIPGPFLRFGCKFAFRRHLDSITR